MKFCTPRERNPGNVLLTWRNLPKYFISVLLSECCFKLVLDTILPWNLTQKIGFKLGFFCRFEKHQFHIIHITYVIDINTFAKKLSVKVAKIWYVLKKYVTWLSRFLQRCVLFTLSDLPFQPAAVVLFKKDDQKSQNLGHELCSQMNSVNELLESCIR